MFKGKNGIYNRVFKRLIDIVCALLAIIVFFWLYAIIAVLVRVKLGSPVIFKQARPGRIDSKTGKETIFYLYKFRTMTDAKDKDGKLLPDDARLTKFGRLLRSTSMEGKVIIRQTTESLVNKGFCKISPIHFFAGCNLIPDNLLMTAA